MKYKHIDLTMALDEIYEQVKKGEMEIVSISAEPNLQPRYLTDDLKETKRKNKLEYYEYNLTLRKYNERNKNNETNN